MPETENERAPYDDVIDANRIDHVTYFSHLHHVPPAAAIKIIRQCKGERLAAETAIKAIRAYYTQSIDPP